MVASAAARRSAPGRRKPRRRPKPVPAPPISLSPCSDQSFTLFPKLPIELRNLIWRFATHRRPRVIQLWYDPSTREWQASKAGRGGLPSIIGVAQEARAEALRRYIRVFDTFCDLQEDTIYISDHLFILRKHRNVLLEMECMKLFKHIAFSREIYEFLAEFHEGRPMLCESPAALLRRFDQLEYFSIVIDDEDFFYDVPTEDNEERLDFDDDEDFLDDVSTEDNDEQLDFDDDEAFEEKVNVGHFASRDNIHFESAYTSDLHWNCFENDMSFCVTSLRDEKAEHSNWVQPKFSVVEVCNGLSQIGDFYQWIHDRGDYSGDILEQELADE